MTLAKITIFGHQILVGMICYSSKNMVTWFMTTTPCQGCSMVLFEATVDENHFLPDLFVPLFEKRIPTALFVILCIDLTVVVETVSQVW
jgi:hypothetical protein